VFLDADDRLLTNACSSGLKCLIANPQAGFAYGHVRVIDESGAIVERPEQPPVHADHYRVLLRYNYIWTPGAVIYRKAVLDVVGAFDRSLNPVADLDLSYRITRSFPVCCNDQVVLEYRRHSANMSDLYSSMLRSYGVVLRKQYAHVARSPEDRDALRTHWIEVQADYGEKAIDGLVGTIRRGNWGAATRMLAVLLRCYPRGIARRIVGS
jgi:hypothetical protein